MRRLTPAEKATKERNIAFLTYVGIDCSLFMKLGKEFYTEVLSKPLVLTLPSIKNVHIRSFYEGFLNKKANEVEPDCGEYPIILGSIFDIFQPHLSRTLQRMKSNDKTKAFIAQYNSSLNKKLQGERLTPYRDELFGVIYSVLCLIELNMESAIPQILGIKHGEVKYEVTPVELIETINDRGDVVWVYAIPEAEADGRKILLTKHSIDRLRSRLGFNQKHSDYITYCSILGNDFETITYRGGIYLPIKHVGCLLGYLKLIKYEQCYLAKTFLLTTMDETPEGDAFKIKCKADRRLIQYVGLDSLAKIVAGEVAQDPVLYNKFCEYGLEGLVKFALHARVPDVDKGMIPEAYRLFKIKAPKIIPTDLSTSVLT